MPWHSVDHEDHLEVILEEAVLVSLEEILETVGLTEEMDEIDRTAQEIAMEGEIGEIETHHRLDMIEVVEKMTMVLILVTIISDPDTDR